MVFLLRERFWTDLLHMLSDHGPHTVVAPILFALYGYPRHEGLGTIEGLFGLIVTYGCFLRGAVAQA